MTFHWLQYYFFLSYLWYCFYHCLWKTFVSSWVVFLLPVTPFFISVIFFYQLFFCFDFFFHLKEEEDKLMLWILMWGTIRQSLNGSETLPGSIWLNTPYLDGERWCEVTLERQRTILLLHCSFSLHYAIFYYLIYTTVIDLVFLARMCRWQET